MLKKYLFSVFITIVTIVTSACNGGGGSMFVSPSPVPVPTTSPSPIIESGSLYFNMASLTLAPTVQSSLQLNLVKSQNVALFPVALASYDPSVAIVSPTTCYMSSESSGCNLIVTALESGVTTIYGVTSSYVMPTTIVNVTSAKPSSGLSFNLQSVNLNAGESTAITLTLNNLQQTTPITVNLESNPTGFFNFTPSNCSLSASNPSCIVTVYAKDATGTATLNATATGYTTTSTTIIVELPLTGWTATNAAPSTVNGRANNIGFSSDQDGNLYLSYQGSDRFAVYRYLFNQQVYAWTQIASTLNQSVGSYNSSISVDRRSNIYLTYLTHPTTDSSALVAYFSALPDKIDFNNAGIIEHVYPYTFIPNGTNTGACDPANRVESDTASEVTAALTVGDTQIMAYSDTTSVKADAYEVKEGSTVLGYCTNDGYSGGGKLTVYGQGFDSRSISAGAVSYVQIKSTPPNNSYPIYVAYKDASYNGSVTVLKTTSIGGQWVTVGESGFTGKSVDHLSLAVDSTGTPYVAFESSNQLLAVRKWDGNNWINVGNPYLTTKITTWISIVVNPITDEPYVAYQESNKIKVKKFNGVDWVAVGSDLANISNNYGAYTSLIMRQTDISDYEPAIAYQASPPNASASSLSVYYYIPPASVSTLISKYKNWQPNK